MFLCSRIIRGAECCRQRGGMGETSAPLLLIYRQEGNATTPDVSHFRYFPWCSKRAWLSSDPQRRRQKMKSLCFISAHACLHDDQAIAFLPCRCLPAALKPSLDASCGGGACFGLRRRQRWRQLQLTICLPVFIICRLDLLW